MRIDTQLRTTEAAPTAAARQTPVTRAAIVGIVSRATAAVFDVVAYAALRLYALVTVNAYLVGRGHGAAARKRWGSAFGRAAAKASRKAGMEPTRLREVTTTGRTATAFAYAGRDVTHLDAAYDLYAERLRAEDATR